MLCQVGNDEKCCVKFGNDENVVSSSGMTKILSQVGNDKNVVSSSGMTGILKCPL